ncbi:MAG: type II toxin-antitoxin system RelB/DinJ family antitoxin [Clostridia bacterium]|nr:type II toxin-antitoxin system RelB/DinJ family antitoxin [Clostridia bacterium]
MARTSNVFARIEPELKKQAESILNELGIPMSNAIGLFLRQVVLQRGIPFDMKLPASFPLSLGSLTKEQLDTEIEKGFEDYKTGKYQDAEAAFAEIEQEYRL